MLLKDKSINSEYSGSVSLEVTWNKCLYEIPDEVSNFKLVSLKFILIFMNFKCYHYFHNTILLCLQIAINKKQNCHFRFCKY